MMKFSITIETCIYHEPIKKLIGYGEADSVQDLLRKFIHEPDDLPKRLASLRINMYFELITEIHLFTVPEICSYDQLISVIEENKQEWCKKYGYQES